MFALGGREFLPVCQSPSLFSETVCRDDWYVSVQVGSHLKQTMILTINFYI